MVFLQYELSEERLPRHRVGNFVNYLRVSLLPSKKTTAVFFYTKSHIHNADCD